MARTKVFFLLAAVLVAFGGFYFRKHYTAAKPRQYTVQEMKKAIAARTGVGLLRDGDLVFQTSRSAQSQAIQLATHSKFSHCGIVFKKGGKFYVYEAVQPVSLTPFAKWITRGEGGHFAVKRLKNADRVLTPSALAKMTAVGRAFQDKNYDSYFGWADDQLYCSELIWKIYQRGTGLQLGKLEKLKDFDLSHPLVQQKLRERYGKKIPYEETVISPASLFASNLLETVLER